MPPAREIATHPNGSPKMLHVIPRTILQTLKSGRCNSNVFSAHQKLTKGNYVRHFRGVRVLPATRPGLARWILSRIVVAREPPATPVTPVGSPNREPHPSTHASGQPGVNDRTSDQASHVGR